MKVIYNIFRGVVRFVVWIFTVLLANLIYLLTIEPGTKNKITPRKARRIRAMSKVKHSLLNFLPVSVNKFIGTETYRNYLNEHLADGLQLRNNTTNKRAV